jgi:tRNA nucleotidyltransferase (CCA-adding enzyme)
MLGICARLAVPPRLHPLLQEERENAHQVLNLMERRRARSSAARPSDIYHWLHPFAAETCLYLMARAGSEEVRRWISHYFTHLCGTAPLLDGNDLRALGIAPGPVYKQILALLLDARLNGQVTTREDEIALVRRRFGARPAKAGARRRRG